MEVTVIKAEKRNAIGTNQVARLRAAGKIPAVIYGRGNENLHVALAENEFDRHMRQHHRVFAVQVDDVKESIYLQAVQWDSITDRPLHVDLKRIDLNEEISLSIDLVFLGHPVGISKGGRLVKDMNELPVRCLPAAIPEFIELTINELDLDMKVLARDLTLPEGVRLDVAPDALVCHLVLELAAPAAEPAAVATVEPELTGGGQKAADEAKEAPAKDKEKKEKK
jgi:large subunit ribosomal protein L25